MMRTRLAVASVSAMALVFGTACDSSTEPTTEMTLQEQQVIILEILNGAFEGAFGFSDQARQNSMAPNGMYAAAADTVQMASDSLTVDCQVDGAVTFVREGQVVVDTTAQTITISANGTRTDAECQRLINTQDGESVLLTLSGNPNIHVDAVVVLGWTEEPGQNPTFLTGETSIDVSGGFTWFTNDDREGSCSITVSADYAVFAETNTATTTVTGSVCGREVEYNFTATVPTA